jgi:hypothetical protein
MSTYIATKLFFAPVDAGFMPCRNAPIDRLRVTPIDRY